MISEIKKKSVSAVGWSGIEAFCRSGLGFIIQIALARLLSPEDFGIVGMLGFFTMLGGSFIDAGFSAALIQKQNLTEDETSAVFLFNLFAGFLAALGLCAASSWIARFYGLPVLKPLACIAALGLVIGALGSVQGVLLSKELNFRTQMRIGVVTSVVSGAIAVYAAWRGAGVWSFSFQGLAGTIVGTILLWRWHPWRPRMDARLSALWPLFRFGSYLFFAGLMENIYTRLYALLIGKIYSPADLGQYTRADATQQMPGGFLTRIVNRVAFPIFSNVSHDHDLLRHGLQQAVRQLMLVSVPMSLGMLAIAQPLVLTLFGPGWLPCVPFLQILCLGGVLWPLHVLNLSCLMAMGRSDLFFRLEVWKKVVGIIAIIVSINISILAMAWTQVLVGCFCCFLNAFYTGRLLGYGSLQQLKDTAPVFLAAGIMVGCVMAVNMLDIQMAALQLVVQIATGALVYLAICQGANIAAFRQLRRQVVAQLLSRRYRAGQTC